MKLSCLGVSLFPQILAGEFSLQDYIRLMRRLGLDGFDLGMILLKDRSAAELGRLKELIAAESLPLIMVTTAPDFTHPDASRRAAELHGMLANLEVASLLGARYVRIVAGQAHPGVSRREGVEWAVSHFRQLIAPAERAGVRLLYEDHSKTAAWQYLDFSNPPDLFLEIADQLKDTPIRINFDTANVLVSGEDRTFEVLERVYPRVETIHVNDISTRGTMSPTLIGTGIVPNREIFAYLRRRGFNGWLCIEEWGQQGIAGVERAVGFVRNAWAESMPAAGASPG